MDVRDDKGKLIATITGADTNQSGCDEGVWVELQADDGTKPTICLIKDKPGGPHGGDWYLGVYRDAKKAYVCDLSVLFDKDEGPSLQVTKGKEVQIVNLFDLLKKIS